jgi:hypothetical protein
MTQASTNPNKRRDASSIGQPQARLILQDPIAFDQSSQPALRSSLELTPSVTPSMEREKARDLWESLSMEPQVAQERQSERRRLIARAEALSQESVTTQAQLAELQAKIARQEQDRFNHPLIYAGGAAILGLGALAWLERRKRLQLQERELDALALQSSTDFAAVPQLAPSLNLDQRHQVESPEMDFSDELAQEFATDLEGLPAEKLAPIAAVSPAVDEAELPASPPNLSSTDMPDWAQPQATAQHPKMQGKRQVPLPSDLEVAVLSSRYKEKQSLLSLSKRVLGNMLVRKNNLDAASTSHMPTELLSTSSIQTEHPSTLLAQDFDEGSQWGVDQESQQAFDQELRAQQLRHAQDEDLDAGSYDPDQANIELLTQTRVKPISGESAMEHLLELRTAVNGLCVLGRPEGALRLLQEHIDSSPDTCAWAYLQYMQVCELLNARDDFEAMRKRYRTQFNRMAPYWFEPNSHVLGLDGYARATSELCNAWKQGKQQAIQTLQTWLLGPMISRKIMQLPAYHDLFDLYEMLEYVDADQAAPVMLRQELTQPEQTFAASEQADDFVPTVSLLDLDYEFSSDVTLEEKEVAQSERAVTIVKTGNFSVDFNVAGTQLGALPSIPADLARK